MKIEANPHPGLGKVKILIDQLDSTQTFAAQLLKESQVAHGTLILSRFQSRGQGRLGRVWQSKAGDNFTGSLILKHDWKIIPPPFLLSQIAALAIHDLVHEMTAQPCWIKWPNDVIVAEKKISGILISNQWKGQTWESSIVGIGINVNQQIFDPSLNQAISLISLIPGPISMNDVVNMLMQYFNFYYMKLSQGAYEQITPLYFKYLYGVQNPVTIKNNVTNQLHESRVLGVESSGKIKLKIHTTEIQEYDLDQISILLP